MPKKKTEKVSTIINKTKDILTPKKKIIKALDKSEKKADKQTLPVSDADLELSVTKSKKDIVASQRLRFRVFSEEYGAQFDNQHSLDLDAFDKFCTHLVVKDKRNDKIVAYTRLLTKKQMKKAGEYYSSHEFDMQNIYDLKGKVLEIGRTCVHPDYRSGAAINTLWLGIAQFANEYEAKYLIGCASIPLLDGGELVHQLMPKIRRQYFVPEDLRVFPKVPFEFNPEQSDEPAATVNIPPLVKAYLRLGAKIGGEPFWDKEFNCADLFILIDIDRIAARYKTRFFGK